MLKIRNLDSGYGKLRVLKNVSLHVNPGEIVGIIGTNGAGKTTLLHSISGVMRPWAGDIVFDNNAILGIPAHKIVALGCALVPEGRQVFAPMTVEENLLLGAYTQFRRKAGAAIHDELQRIYAMFPILQQRSRQFAGTLSGGEQQMLAIGRALMSKPAFIMLDEPSMGLAPLVVKEIFRAISSLRDSGRTVLIVEQNSKAVLGIADRGYVMETGSIVIEGTAQELLNNTDVQRAYLGKDYQRINE
ncbi:HAAT family amino acid/amide ABC transporter ATP-binding protein 2 [Candidatus Moduliflexus flocculans]|uniref:HAAT family amino acid/amide ABC transporter ATP-binding protein 2 n=1 Tax=Candidatus Moduliflexus flocculans TaxID=1499966 RepID=A0A081BSB4_9BACT|nr:HAAT family amino acid/amide ABC transporter ATP-binding protein 2 [Candidatus Moduliflexus flocculans]